MKTPTRTIRIDPAHERAITEQMQAQGADRCPYCDRMMSRREAIEQGACNDCNGGAYWPDER